MTYSTSGEDDSILAYFKSKGIERGTFLDIGAANGITLSNTHLLALAGWSGVCIDANAQELFNLNNLYWDNPRVEIVEACIGQSRGLKEFWNAKSANISTSSKRMQDRGRERQDARKCWVAGISLNDIWEKFGFYFDFINIDLEDGTLAIMRDLPDCTLERASVICVEHLDPRWYFGEDEAADITNWGAKKGFKVLLRNDENVVLCK